MAYISLRVETRSLLWLLLIKHDVPLKSAVSHVGPGGTICTPSAGGE